MGKEPSDATKLRSARATEKDLRATISRLKAQVASLEAANKKLLESAEERRRTAAEWEARFDLMLNRVSEVKVGE